MFVVKLKMQGSLFIIITALCVIFTKNIYYAQAYKPFPTENAIWNYTYGDPGGTTRYSQEIIGDTIINDTVYTKIEQIEIYGNIATYDTTIFVYFIREENKTIYLYLSENNLEHVIYDFNLDNGSVFVKKCYSAFGETYIDTLFVKNIDSVLLENGEYRKRYELWQTKENPGFEFWIEGIGGENYPINSAFHWESGGFLMCFIDNGNFLISQYCFFVSDEENEVEYSNNIYPNPTNGILYLDFSIPICAIEIFNCEGLSVFKTQESKNIQNIDFSNYKNGVYIIKITTINNVEFRKIIKF
jgi:hypothetical protein